MNTVYVIFRFQDNDGEPNTMGEFPEDISPEGYFGSEKDAEAFCKTMNARYYGEQVYESWPVEQLVPLPPKKPAIRWPVEQLVPLPPKKPTKKR